MTPSPPLDLIQEKFDIFRGESLSWSWYVSHSVGRSVGRSLGHTLADLCSEQPFLVLYSLIYGPVWSLMALMVLNIDMLTFKLP